MFPRGSEWREWGLHMHSPASFHWDGERRFGTDKVRNDRLVDEMIGALIDAAPVAFGLMDYRTFDGWFAPKARQSEQGAAPPGYPSRSTLSKWRSLASAMDRKFESLPKRTAPPLSA